MQGNYIENWKTQIRKGYLELCVLMLIDREKKIYGFDLIEKLEHSGLPVKEGTIYPLLNRMTMDETLQAVWDTENIKGHPRKFYSLTRNGLQLIEEMKSEYERMIQIYKQLGKKE